MGDLRVVACSLDLLLADVVGLGRPCDELVLDRERHLKRLWRHCLDEHLVDRVVERAAVDRLADTGLAVIDATPAANNPAPFCRHSCDTGPSSERLGFQASKTLVADVAKMSFACHLSQKAIHDIFDAYRHQSEL